MIETLMNTNPAVFWTGIALVVTMAVAGIAAAIMSEN